MFVRWAVYGPQSLWLARSCLWESSASGAKGHPKTDSRKRIAHSRTLPVVWLSPVEMPLLLQTSIFFSQHYAIPKGRLLSKGALAIPAMLLFLFANRSLLCLYGHFPFYSYYFSIILNPFPVPTPQKPAGSLQTWEKKAEHLSCLPIPIQDVGSGPEGGHKQPAASRNLTAHSGSLNTLRLTSDKSLPFPPFRGKPRNLPRTISPP